MSFFNTMGVSPQRTSRKRPPPMPVMQPIITETRGDKLWFCAIFTPINVKRARPTASNKESSFNLPPLLKSIFLVRKKVRMPTGMLVSK